MTISLLTALGGFGKTLKLTEFGYYANLHGRPVYSNFRMKNLPNPNLYTHFNDPLEVLGKVKGNANGSALILISEVGIVLPQHRMYEVDSSIWDELSQHRKDGVNIVADCQSWKQPSYLFKELIQFHYEIYSKIKLFEYGKKDEKGYRKSVTFNLVKVRNPINGDFYGRRYWMHKPKYFKYYDTDYKLEKNPSLFDLGQNAIQSPWSDFLKGRQADLLHENVESRGVDYA